MVDVVERGLQIVHSNRSLSNCIPTKFIHMFSVTDKMATIIYIYKIVYYNHTKLEKSNGFGENI